MFSIIKEYLDSTTVHGFSYIHPRNSWLSQIIWVSPFVCKQKIQQKSYSFHLGIDYCCWISFFWISSKHFLF